MLGGHRDPDAGVRADLHPVELESFLKYGDQRRRQRHGGVHPGLGQQHHELVAAQPAHHGGVLDRGSQPRRHHPQQFVTSGVPQRVVHVFEVVEVEKQEGAMESAVVGASFGQHLGRPFVESAAVQQPGQLVGACLAGADTGRPGFEERHRQPGQRGQQRGHRQPPGSRGDRDVAGRGQHADSRARRQQRCRQRRPRGRRTLVQRARREPRSHRDQQSREHPAAVEQSTRLIVAARQPHHEQRVRRREHHQSGGQPPHRRGTRHRSEDSENTTSASSTRSAIG